MEQRLRVLQERELATRKTLVAKFEELLTDMLPRTHLHVLEHGNPATIRAEVNIAYMPTQTEATVSMVLVPKIPRASKVAKLEFKNDEDAFTPRC